MKKSITLKEALNTKYRNQIVEILSQSSSRLKYRRDILKSLFKSLGLIVNFSMADMKEAIEETE